MMEKMIREKQAEVDRLESALSRLNIATSHVQIKFITFLPVARHRSGREEGVDGMACGGGGDREKHF